MPLSNHPELFWLTATTAFTALLWLPYITRFIGETGLGNALWDPTGEHPFRTPWAQRAHRAHQNAVENLVVFAPLAIVVDLLSAGTPITAAAAGIYFAARVAHYVVYTLGLPVVRTVVFAIAWGCQIVLLLTLFQVL